MKPTTTLVIVLGAGLLSISAQAQEATSKNALVGEITKQEIPVSKEAIQDKTVLQTTGKPEETMKTVRETVEAEKVPRLEKMDQASEPSKPRVIAEAGVEYEGLLTQIVRAPGDHSRGLLKTFDLTAPAKAGWLRSLSRSFADEIDHEYTGFNLFSISW